MLNVTQGVWAELGVILEMTPEPMLLSTTASGKHIHSALTECICAFFLSFLLLGLLNKSFQNACLQVTEQRAVLTAEVAGVKGRGQSHGWLGGVPGVHIYLPRLAGQCPQAQFFPHNHDTSSEMK